MKPSNEHYVLVLEDTLDNSVIGLASIRSVLGNNDSYYYYNLEGSNLSKVQKGFSLLRPRVLHDGPSEIGSLFLDSKYRSKGLGRIISLSRFVFMKMHSHRFKNQVISEIRGVSYEDGSAPFWDNIGRKLININFSEANLLFHQSHSEFLIDFLKFLYALNFYQMM